MRYRRGPRFSLVIAWIFLFGLVASGAGAQEGGAERTATSEHFSITWSEDPRSPARPDPGDADASGVPDAVEATLAAFEAARSFIVGDLGYQPPPGDEPYRIYLASRAEARVLLEDDTSDSSPSFIVFPVAVTGRPEALPALAAHEYHHAVQHGYDSREDRWIAEATSTYIENLFVGESRAALDALIDFVPVPREPLDETSGIHEYGAFLFLQYLSERHGGPASIRDLWELMAVPEAVPGAGELDSLHAIEAVLARRGVALTEAWNEFHLWRWRLGHFVQGNAYRDAVAAAGWPTLLRTTTVRSESCRLETGFLPSLSGDYVRLRPARPVTGSAEVVVEGLSGATAFLLIKEKGRPPQERPLVLDANGLAETTLSFASPRTSAVTLGLGNATIDGPERDVAYSLRVEGRASKVSASSPSGPTWMTYRDGVDLTGSVTCRGEPAPAATVAITETESVTGASRTFMVETNPVGLWRLDVNPEVNSSYSASVVDPLLSPAISGSKRLDVRVFVEINLSARRVTLGTPISITGVVTPTHEVPIMIEFRRPDGVWLEGATVPVGADGGYRATLVLPAEGVWEVRARAPDTGDDDHAPGTSLIEVVEVTPG